MVQEERLIDCYPDAYCYHRNCGFLRKLLTGGDEGIGTVVATNARLIFIRAKGGKQRLLGTPTVETVPEIGPLLERQGGFTIQLSDLDAISVTFSGFGRYGYGQGFCSELTITYGGGTTVKAFRFAGKETAERLLRSLEGPIGQEAWLAHRHELANLPTPQQRAEILMTWRGIIDQKAHDYADLVSSHPRRDQIAQLEAEIIIQAYLCGFMAHQGWIEEVEAQQAAFMLGRALRDQLRGLGVSFDTLNVTFGLAMTEALEAIVKLGIEKGA